MFKYRFHLADYLSRLDDDRRLSLKETVARASTYLFGMVALWGVTYLCLAASELLRP